MRCCGFDSCPRTHFLEVALTLKRVFVCFLCVFTFLASSCFAWDEFSFIGNPVEDVVSWYDLPQVSAFSFDDGISPLADSAPSLSGASFWSAMSWRSSNLVRVYQNETFTIGSYPSIPSQTVTAFYSYDLSIPTPSLSDGANLYSFDPSSWYQNNSGRDFNFALAPVINPITFSGSGVGTGFDYGPAYYDLDISSLGSFSSFELDGGFGFFHSFNVYTTTKIDLIVNGQIVTSFFPDDSNMCFFNHFLFNSTSLVSSVSFAVYFNPARLLSSTDTFTSWGLSSYKIPSYDIVNCSFSVLVDLPGYLDNVDKSQDAIYDYERDSSQWIGSMSSNFAQLSMSSFSFPTNLSGAASLLTGIFNDVWVAMGDYKIIYVFPLFLGLALVLIGRMAKYAAVGHSHGYGSDKGADG